MMQTTLFGHLHDGSLCIRSFLDIGRTITHRSTIGLLSWEEGSGWGARTTRKEVQANQRRLCGSSTGRVWFRAWFRNLVGTIRTTGLKITNGAFSDAPCYIVRKVVSPRIMSATSDYRTITQLGCKEDSGSINTGCIVR